MINKRIALSLMSIVAAMAVVGGAAFAQFTNSVTSNGNTFSTGVMDLQIRDNDEGFSDAVTASIVAENMTPGGDITESFVCFRNTGDYDIQEIILSMSATGNVNALAPYINTTKIELAAVLPGECAEFAGGDFSSGDYTSLFLNRFDSDNNGYVTLKESLDQVNGDDRINDDLLNRPEAVLPADPNVLLKFRTTWQLDIDAPNSAQGKSVVVNTTYVGNQTEVDEDTPTP